MADGFQVMDAPAWPRVRDRFSVDEFMVISEARVFGDAVHLELHDGKLVEMTAEGSRHAFNKGAAYALLRQLAQSISGLKAAPDLAVRLDDSTVIAPDVVVIEAPTGRPSTVPASWVRLALEHADTSLDYDLGKKARMYAEAAIPELWVLDDRNLQLNRFHSPESGAYRRDPPLALDDEIAVPFAPGERICVRDLFDLD